MEATLRLSLPAGLSDALGCSGDNTSARHLRRRQRGSTREASRVTRTYQRLLLLLEEVRAAHIRTNGIRVLAGPFWVVGKASLNNWSSFDWRSTRQSASLIGPTCQAQRSAFGCWASGFSNRTARCSSRFSTQSDPTRRSALHALVRRNGEPRLWTRFSAQRSFAASSGPSSTP